MIGFRSTVQGLLPILPSRVRRIGIFCFTHRCCPVLLPAGSIRSSSLVSRYEDCFKPTVLQVPGYPLRPYRTASGFSGLYGSTCWRKTGKNCISHGHTWKLAYLLRTFEGATEMSIFGWWRLAGTPLPVEIWNCRIHRIKLKSPDWKSSLDISHIESEAAWNRNPQRWKFPLHPWEPCESSASKLGLGCWNLGNTRLLRRFKDKSSRWRRRNEIETQVCEGFGEKLCDFCPLNCSVAIQTHAETSGNADDLPF